MTTSDTPEQVHDMAHTRHEDPAGLKVSREIPLPWLIGIIGTIFLQAALVYFKQDSQAETLLKLSEQVKGISSALGSKDLKDLEHDIRIADLQTRMSDVQARISTIEGRLQGLNKK